jgi:hypothetical protein
MRLSFSDCFFVLIHALGVLFICAALFLYENEEGQIQNKLEEWWVRLSDREKQSRSRAVAFMQDVADSTGRGFDRLFGKRLLSLRFVFVSITFSLASIFLFAFILWPLAHNPPPNVSRQHAFLFFVLFAAFGSVPAFVDGETLWDRTMLGLWWAIIVFNLLRIARFILFTFSTMGVGRTARGIGYLTLFFTSGVLCDLSYIVLTRWILRRISKIDRVHEIILQALVSLLILVTLVWAPISFGARIGRYFPMTGGAVLFSFVLNSVDVIVGLAALMLALLLLLHRLVWPTVERPIYAMERFGFIKRKKLLWTAGIVLVLPTYTIFQLLTSLLDRL